MSGPGPSCGVCGESYTKTERRPRALLCGHTFCTLCLEEAIRAKSCNCPSCSQPFIAFAASQLPTDFSVLQKIASSSSGLSASSASPSRKPSWDKSGRDEPDAFRSAFSRLSSTRYGQYDRDIASGNTSPGKTSDKEENSIRSEKTPDKEEKSIHSSRWPRTQSLFSRRRYTDNEVYSDDSECDSDSSRSKEKDLGSGVSKYRTNSSSYDLKPFSRTNPQPGESFALSRLRASPANSSSDATLSTPKKHGDEEQESRPATPGAGPRARRPSSERATWKLPTQLEVGSPASIPESPGSTTSTPKHVLQMCRSLTNKHRTSGRDSEQLRQRTPTPGESTDDDAADALGPPPPLPGTGPPAVLTGSEADDRGCLQESGDTKQYEEIPADFPVGESSAPNGNELQETKMSEYDKKRDDEVQTSVETWPKSDASRSLRTRLSRRALSRQYALEDDEADNKDPQHSPKPASFHSRSSLSSSVTTPSEDSSKESTRKLGLRRYRSLGTVDGKSETKSQESEAYDVSRSLSRSHSTKQEAGNERSTTPALSRRQGYEDMRIKSDWKYHSQEEVKNDNTHPESQEDKENSHWTKRRFRLSGNSKSVDESHKEDATSTTTSKGKVGNASTANIWSKYSPSKPKEPSDSFSQERKILGFSQHEDEPKTNTISSSITSRNREDMITKTASVRDWKIPRKMEHEEQIGKKTETTDTSSLKTTLTSRSSRRVADLPSSPTDKSSVGLLRIGIVPSIQTVSEESEQTDDNKDVDTVDAPLLSKARLTHGTSRGSETFVPKSNEGSAPVTSKRQQESLPASESASLGVRYSAGEADSRNKYDGKQTHSEANSINAPTDNANIYGNFRQRNRYQEHKKLSNPHIQRNVRSDDAAENIDEKQRRYPEEYRQETSEASRHKRDRSNQDREDRVARGCQSSQELTRKPGPTPTAEVLQKLPDTGLCGTHGSIVQLYCQRCEMWICEECLDMLHSPSPAGLCRVMSTSEALLGLKEKHSEFLTSRISTLNHFRRDLKKLLFECENSVEEHEATILELGAKMEEEQRLIEGIETMKALVLEKGKQIDSWEDLLQKNANRIERSGTSHDMISAVERNRADILRRFRENEELEIAVPSDFARE